MNLCSLTLKTSLRFRDDRPFSSGKNIYSPLNGLKNESELSSNSYDSDDFDDPELIFDSNHLYRDERIYETN